MLCITFRIVGGFADIITANFVGIMQPHIHLEIVWGRFIPALLHYKCSQCIYTIQQWKCITAYSNENWMWRNKYLWREMQYKSYRSCRTCLDCLIKEKNNHGPKNVKFQRQCSIWLLLTARNFQLCCRPGKLSKNLGCFIIEYNQWPGPGPGPYEVASEF